MTHSNTHNDSRRPGSIASAAASADSRSVKVSILGKDLQMACTAGSEDDLHHAAQYVHRSMSAFRAKNKSLSIEKIAIVTAINIANDLLKNNTGITIDSDSSDDNNELSQQLQSLSARIDTVLQSDS